MAQAGYTPIQLYYSTTPTNQPTAGNLVDGELAINTADGKLFYKDGATVKLLASNASSTGTVQSVSVVSANGFAGTVATDTSTPAITLTTSVTGVLKGNGTAISAAVAATDYVAPSAYASVNGLTMATARLLGRTTASTGAAEEITVGSGLTLSAGTLTGSGGTVTSVSFTGGLITVATATSTPALTVAGTSGGIVYFSSASTWASSGVLAASSIVIGGGAGVAPSTTTTGAGVVTALGIAVNSGSGGLVTNTGTATLTNKRITPRVTSITGAAGGTITPTGDTADQYNITALGAAATFAIPSGTPTDGQNLSIRIEDNGTGRALTWTTSAGGYRVIGTTLPTTTTATKTIYVGCVYNSNDSFWDVVAVATQA